MNSLLPQIIDLISQGQVRISAHGYNELSADDILVREVIAGVASAEIVEEYPHYPKGPCVLTLQRDQSEKPIHVLWGIPKGAHAPAVLITAYRPDPRRWSDEFRRRIG